MPEQGLGRKRAFDQRSRLFGILEVETRPPRPYTWGSTFYLDQGPHPECVGFSWSAEMGAKPVVIPVDDAQGRALYREAQAIDRAEGRFWPEGASVLAGAKAVKAAGNMDEFRWAFGVDELATAVSWTGPAVIGVDWMEGMMATDSAGFIHPTGASVGGHAILVRGYNVRARRFLLHNSWGKWWGRSGTCFISHDDLGFLLANMGEACIPIRRRKSQP